MKKIFSTFSIRGFDFVLFALVLLLSIIGIIAIGSAAPEQQMRQIYGLIIGVVGMLILSALDYQKILKFYWIWYILNLLLLGLVRISGGTGGGAQRWITIGGITFQPSEAAKILLILFYAAFIMKNKNRMNSIWFTLVCLLLALPPLKLIYDQPDLTTTMMVFIIIVMMMFVGGMNWKLVAGVLAISVPSAIVFINLVIQEGSTILNSYQRGRILAWLHPEDYATTLAYQTMNSIMAIGSGQLLGKGYNTNEFNSLLNSGYISESQTDFVFTVIGEEFGFAGACTVVLVLSLIAIKLFWNARECKDFPGMLITVGMGTWIGFQGLMNIGVTTGVFPNTGIPLPFVSYGLTSLVSLYAGIGVVMNVRMQNRRKRRDVMFTSRSSYISM